MLKLIVLISRGILRDTRTRRKFMFWVMLAALIQLFCGTVFISDQWAREHPWTTMAFWFLCAWLTLTGMLLALFDILLLRAAHRIARRKIESQIMDEAAKQKPPE